MLTLIDIENHWLWSSSVYSNLVTSKSTEDPKFPELNSMEYDRSNNTMNCLPQKKRLWNDRMKFI
jgi:hypothetical protein